MPGIVIAGNQEQVPGISVLSWLDNPILRLKAVEDMRQRYTPWVRAICLHTTKGVPGGTDNRPQVIKPGMGPFMNAAVASAKDWATDGRHAGAHLLIDFDGSVACMADLAKEAAYHAGEVNEVTIGIEIFQGSQAEMYDGQLGMVVKLLDWLTKRFGIQRQIHWPYRNNVVVPRIASGGQDVVGVYGHRDVTTNRGLGDPGDAVFQKLITAGYESYNMILAQDKAAWMSRQTQLGITADGVPGPGTVAALKAAGRSHGLWVARPGDDSDQLVG